MSSSQRKIQHLYWRTGFGPPLDLPTNRSVNDELAIILKKSEKSEPLVLKDWDPLLAKEFKLMTDADKAAYRKQERQARLQINQDILSKYTLGQDALRGKMTFFWMGHFACRIANPVFVVKYYNTINDLALGKFGDLLRAMIRNASLLQYLNNNQNRKSSPNENFARELLELFTLGIGNYTENDVKEGARAMTGWGFDRFGEFMIRQEHHDKGTKNFLGEQGDYDGDDLVNIILKKKQCARFITTKLYRFFVNDVPNEKLIDELSDRFFASGYDIKALMKDMVSADWFYNDENMGAKIKSPLELLAGIVRNFNIRFENPLTAVQLQKVLGQMLFDPPNVAGWPGGRSWIDSSTLLYRMRLPELLLQEAESIMSPKEEFDALETLKVGKIPSQNNKKVKTTFDKMNFEKKFTGINETEITKSVMQFLLQADTGREQVEIIENLLTGDKGPERIFKTAIYVMSLPEYQLC